MSLVTDWATSQGFAASWQLVRRMPEPAAYRLFNKIADQLWARGAGGVDQLERNLTRVHPDYSALELRELSRTGMRSYMRYWCEAFRLPSWSPSRISDYFFLERHEFLDAALESGRGAIMVPGHMGNWDHAGAWAALRYGGLTTVAERLKPEKLFDQFLAYREGMGFEVLPLGDSDVVRTLARRLKEGKLVALLGDRDLRGSGVPVEFFGESASMPGGPAVLALLTGAPLHPVSLWFDGERATGYVHDEVVIPQTGTREEKVALMTQQIASALESGIREHSDDWHMLQKVWWSDIEGQR